MPQETRHSKWQDGLDWAVIVCLRTLQTVAVIALVGIGAMGFSEVARSVKTFMHEYHFLVDHKGAGPDENTHRDDSATVTKPGAASGKDQSLPDFDRGYSTTFGPVEFVLGVTVDGLTLVPAPPIGEGSSAHDDRNTEKELKAEDERKKQREHDPISIAFQGLEFLLLAPLFFLLLRSLTEYVADLVRRAKLNAAMAAGIMEEQAKAQKRIGLSIGKEDLLETKALSFGLLFAIVATHMVGQLISGVYSDALVKGATAEIIVGLSLLIIIAGIYFALESFGHKIKMTPGGH